MRRLGYALGVPLVVLGAYLVLSGNSFPALTSIALWFAGGIALHDGLVVPITLAVGSLLLLAVRGPARAAVQGALIVTACVTVATLPLLVGAGRDARVPSQQPLDYGRNLLMVLALVWVVAAAVAVRRSSTGVTPRRGPAVRPR